jgi:hypothetical protein
MKNFKKITQLLITASILLGGCTSVPTAPEHSGKWKKINLFESRINTIPLEKEYFFTALKIDSTLLALLQRWATDVNLSLEVRCSNDYSVSEKLFDVQTRSLLAATEEINFIYAKQELNISLNKEASLLVFSCGKFNKSKFLPDNQIKTIDLSKDLSKQPVFEADNVVIQKVTLDEQKVPSSSLKLNISNSIDTNKTKVVNK